MLGSSGADRDRLSDPDDGHFYEVDDQLAWVRGSELHRVSGPAVIVYDSTGIVYPSWHADGGVAYSSWNRDGNELPVEGPLTEILNDAYFRADLTEAAAQALLEQAGGLPEQGWVAKVLRCNPSPHFSDEFCERLADRATYDDPQLIWAQSDPGPPPPNDWSIETRPSQPYESRRIAYANIRAIIGSQIETNAGRARGYLVVRDELGRPFDPDDEGIVEIRGFTIDIYRTRESWFAGDAPKARDHCAPDLRDLATLCHHYAGFQGPDD